MKERVVFVVDVFLAGGVWALGNKSSHESH